MQAELRVQAPRSRCWLHLHLHLLARLPELIYSRAMSQWRP